MDITSFSGLPLITNVAVIIKDSCVEFPLKSIEVGESLGLGTLGLKNQKGQQISE